MNQNEKMDKHKIKYRKRELDREKIEANKEKIKEKKRRNKEIKLREKELVRKERETARIEKESARRERRRIREEEKADNNSGNVVTEGNEPDNKLVSRVLEEKETETNREISREISREKNKEISKEISKETSREKNKDTNKEKESNNKQNTDRNKENTDIDQNSQENSGLKNTKIADLINNPTIKFSAAVAVMLVISLSAYFLLRTHKAKLTAVETMNYAGMEEVMEYSYRESKKAGLIKAAGKDASAASAKVMRYMLEGIGKRPEEVELTAESATEFATIESCLFNSKTGKVDVKVTAPTLAASDDGYYYIFAEKPFDTEISGDEYIIEEQKDTELTFSVNLNYNSANSRLFSKFVVAMLKDGEFVEISKPRYITNPEEIAKYNPSFSQTKSKKGLLVDPTRLSGSELDDLGVKHAAYNIFLSRFFSGSGINYTYNGKTYSFSRSVVEEYDHVFSTLTRKGIDVTAIILNNASGKAELIHPLARSGGSAPYAAFNAADESGIEHIAAIASFLAERYSGNSHGKVMNWIIGNEINARHEWNYIKYMETKDYVEEYAKAFRVFYNAIRSVNGNARVYISLDQQWGQSLTRTNGYGSKEILDAFNINIKNGGNIDWAVAQHPYNYPLNSAKAWSPSGKAASYILDSETTPVLSIKNIHVLTDYLQKEEFLTDSGEVRHVSLSEMGYTSSAGQELQAASFVYAYKIVEANQYIDSLLLSRQTDASVEVAQGLALGLNTPGGGHKSIYNAYKYIDTDKAAEYTDFALKLIGISSWGEVIKSY